jgi:hypothetical protein
MAFLTPPNASHFDANQVPSIMGVIGTLGTVDQAGTALPLPIGVNKDSGAMYVHISGTDVDLSGAAAGTFTNIVTGTQQTLGTVGVVEGGTIAEITLVPTVTTVSNLTNGTTRISVGTVSAFEADIPGGTMDLVSNLNSGSVRMTVGTVSVLPDLPGGTVDEVTLVPTVTTVSNLTNGTTRISVGTITALPSDGTITALAVGTIGGKAASGAAAVANPVLVGGTDSGGTVYAPLVDTAGNFQVDVVNTPTVDVTASSFNTGTITSVSNIVKGTILNSGTTTGVGVVSNLTNGTVRVAAGTQQTLGTVGVLNNGTLAQVTSISNVVKGTTSMVHAGTIDTIGALPNVTLNDIAGGTIDEVTSVSNIVKGTILNSGTTTGVGVVTTVTDVTDVTNVTSGTLARVGTVQNLDSGTLAEVTSVTNLADGTVHIDSVPARTVIRYGTLGTSAAEVRGTLVVAAGAGDNYYIEGYEILQHSGTTDCAIELGTKAVVGGTDTFGRGFYVPGGGVSRSLTNPIVSGANGTITYYMGGAGTTFFAVDYYEVG